MQLFVMCLVSMTNFIMSKSMGKTIQVSLVDHGAFLYTIPCTFARNDGGVSKSANYIPKLAIIPRITKNVIEGMIKIPYIRTNFSTLIT